MISSLFAMARRFRLATTLNFVGMAVAFAAFYLFMTQVVYNHSFNRSLTDYRRLYRLEVPDMWSNSDRWSPNISRLMGDELAELPQVEDVMLVSFGWRDLPVLLDDVELPMKYAKTGDGGLRILAPRCLDGRLDWSDGDRSGVLIPASIARTYFNNETQVVGRCIMMKTGADTPPDSLVVRGVYDDFPANCDFENAIFMNYGDENLGVFNNLNYRCYVRLPEQADTAAVMSTFRRAYDVKVKEAFIAAWGEEHWNDPRNNYGHTQCRLTPVTDTYFSGVDSRVDKGNRMVDLVLQVACAMLLIVAAINFLNFMLAEAPMRVRGVNTRRVLGSTRESIRAGFIAEAVVVAVAACVAGLGIAYLLSQWPPMAELVQGLTPDPSPVGEALAGVTLLLSILVGIVAGLYPAFYVTSFQPALALKGSAGLTPRGRQLRTALIGVQLFISSVMVIYIAILYLQSHFIFSSDYGFAKDETLYVRLPEEMMAKKAALRAEVLKLPGVEGVAYSQFLCGAGDVYMSWGRRDDEHSIDHMAVFPVDYHYFQTLGIHITEGRDFNEHDDEVFIINQAARRAWDWVELGKPLLNNSMGAAVGVCDDVRFGSTRIDRTASPMAFMVYKESAERGYDPLYYMNIRVSPLPTSPKGEGLKSSGSKWNWGSSPLGEVRRGLTVVLKDLGWPGDPDVRFLDQDLEETYQEEFRFIRQVLVFAVVCLIVTLIGVFCLTLFETEYRRKEIGIRKVFGSTEEAILVLLSRRYVLLILVSFLAAAPVAFYIGREWLQNFAERTPIYWWLFPATLAAVALITLGTVCIQGWRAATENPINSIKTE